MLAGGFGHGLVCPADAERSPLAVPVNDPHRASNGLDPLPILGIQRDGLEVFAPNGRAFRFPAWSFERVLMPWIVRRGIYGGIRDTPSR